MLWRSLQFGRQRKSLSGPGLSSALSGLVGTTRLYKHCVVLSRVSPNHFSSSEMVEYESPDLVNFYHDCDLVGCDYCGRRIDACGAW